MPAVSASVQLRQEHRLWVKERSKKLQQHKMKWRNPGSSSRTTMAQQCIHSDYIPSSAEQSWAPCLLLAQLLVKYTQGALRHNSVTAAQASSVISVHILRLCCIRYLKTRGIFWRRDFKVTWLFIINLSLKKELNTLAPTPAFLLSKTFYKAQSNFWAGRMAVWPAQAGRAVCQG